MQTKRLIYRYKKNDTAIKQAAFLLQSGDPVAFPTETVYGLGADATNEQAVAKIFKAKGRPSDNPLIVHVATKEQLAELVQDYPDYVAKMMDAFSPGPITYVLKSNHKVARNVTGGLETVGVRIPDHPVALALLQECKLPLAAPSANLSGKPSPTTAQHVVDDLDGRIPAILDGGSANVGVESTVVDCTGAIPVILRLGHVTKAAIETVVGEAGIAASNQSETPKSPGVKYKHYVPEVPLILVSDEAIMKQAIAKEKAQGKKIGALISTPQMMTLEVDKLYRLGESKQEMAANLYGALRGMSKTDVDVVFAIGLTEERVGSAVLDRLQRAAEKNIS